MRGSPRDKVQNVGTSPEAPLIFTGDSLSWAYQTPLDPPGEGVTLNPRVIVINGMPFQARSDCKYQTDYYALADGIERVNKFTPEERKANPGHHELNYYRNLLQRDLWAVVYFAMKNPLANHPFIVEACKEIQNEKGDSSELWARDHLKTSIITVARQIQKVLNNPERRILIFSAVIKLSIKILNLIRSILETPFLIACFPDILYSNPQKEAIKWSEEGGLFVKRKGFYKEATFMAAGLIEGMPTGDHYTDLIYDDIVTADHVSPDVTETVISQFEVSLNIGDRDTQITIIGTPYTHTDALAYIVARQDPVTNKPTFPVRKKPATVDGTFTGKSVFLPERALAKKRAGKRITFYCQQLIDPTPRGEEKLNYRNLRTVSRKELPSNLYRFMLIDGSGDKGKRIDRAADCWAMVVIGVEPVRQKDGSNRIYILDLMIREMDLFTAQNAAVEMYCRNGRILKLGIEKVGMSTTEIHICNALAAKGRVVSIERGNLEILNPAGRSKEYRIESALTWPLNNGKIHLLDNLPVADVTRLGLEMEKFPAWKDDGMDAISYVYDIIKAYRFAAQSTEGEKPDAYFAAYNKRRANVSGGWIKV